MRLPQGFQEQKPINSEYLLSPLNSSAIFLEIFIIGHSALQLLYYEVSDLFQHFLSGLSLKTSQNLAGSNLICTESSVKP